VLADRQRYRCARCGLPLIGNTEVDHFIPKARGGKDRMSNYRLLHASCNRDKSDALE
jgi:5-methylcytosine-specific restriction endonuclease McrA